MFYEFNQNNTGGSFDVNDKLCHRLVIEANNKNEAIKIAEDLGCYWDGCDEGIDCPCCGDRWYSNTHEIDLDKIKKSGYNLYVYSFLSAPYDQSEQTVLATAKELWFKKFGKYPRLSEPMWSEKNSGSFNSRKFSALVYFETIEDYCQYMADEYGCTEPDIRIFYKDGTIKEIFKQNENN